MTDNTPQTRAAWDARLGKLRALRDTRQRHFRAAEDELAAALYELQVWENSPERLFAAWAPHLAKMSAEIGVDFSVVHNGGGTHAIRGEHGPLRILITDWGDGDLSHPDQETGYMVGFSLPDAPWTGLTESLVGDPAAHAGDELTKLVAFALSGYMRGERYFSDAHVKQVAYGYEQDGFWHEA